MSVAKDVPWTLIASALRELAPVVIAPLMEHMRALGIDLGPVPPDLRPRLAQVDAEIDAEIKAMEEKSKKGP